MGITFDRSEFNADITSKMDDIRENYLDDGEGDDVAFAYTVAAVFEGEDILSDENSFIYTDGANDHGVDFYIARDDGYTFYQCKSCNLDNYPEGKVFDATPVNELQEAVEFITSDNDAGSNAGVRKLKQGYQFKKANCILTAVLALEGRLSDSARRRFEEVRSQKANEGINICLYEENDIYDCWHRNDEVANRTHIELKLTTRDINDCVIWQNGWFCAVLDVKPLIDAIAKYGYDLFDMNVRSTLKGSNVNAAIKKQLSTEKGRKRFVHLNNGIVITCNNYVKPSQGDRKPSIKVADAQVVNGCQTLSTIFDFYMASNDSVKESICSDVKIIAKVLNSSTANQDELFDDIIVASNHQNPMNDRNLKSNSAEQRKLQSSFYKDPLKKEMRYFYIRKDGELDSFLQSNKREPKKSYFEIKGSTRRGKNRYRHIDNEDLAKIWWAWIGNAPKANAGGVKYFRDPEYSSVFAKRPSPALWEQMKKPNFSYKADLLEDGQPTQYQLLLAMAVGRYLEYRVKPVGTTKLKNEALARLEDTGVVSPRATQQEKLIALNEDNDFLFGVWKAQMALSVAEIGSFLLCNKYGTLDSDTCKRLLDLNDVSFWLKKGMDKSVIEDSDITEGPNRLLVPLYELVNQGLRGFLKDNKRLILGQSRPKMYLGRRENLIEIKKECLERNELYREDKFEFKPSGRSYLEAFPEV